MFRANTARSYVLTVSELTGQIQTLLEESFDSFAVSGEISNARLYPSGHWYFSLKDKEATLSCVCWKSTVPSIPFELQDGLQVIARGRISVYPQRGQYQMVVSALQPVGVGDWQLAFNQLKEKLDKEGLLAAERKRAVPLLPRRIGVVTSSAAAALRDILTALKRRNPGVQVLISPCRVQGDGSAEEIAEAINNLQQPGDIDVIIVARGGGSIEDLWSFNTEIVARAVAGSRIPVISGVGHETDVTICDLVADLRAPTPTAAAEMVARGRIELVERWSNQKRRLLFSMQERVSSARIALQKLDPRYALLRHVERMKKMSLRVSASQVRLVTVMEVKINNWRNRWRLAHDKLLALSALAVLERGYSILQKEDGRIVRRAGEVEKGEIISGRLHSGKLRLQVMEVDYE